MKPVYLLFVSAFALFFASCDDYDRKPPTVEFIKINNQLFGITVDAGSENNMEYSIVDNRRIRDVLIKVEKGFRSEANIDTITNLDFNYANGFDASNDVKREPIAFPVPATARAGTYRIVIQAEDDNGNLSAARTLNFVVKHPEQAQMGIATTSTFTGTDITNDGIEDIRRNDRIRITGNVNSTSDITKVKVELLAENNSAFSRVYRLNGNSDFAVDLDELFMQEEFNVPGTTPSGYNELIITTTTANGHSAVYAKSYNVLF